VPNPGATQVEMRVFQPIDGSNDQVTLSIDEREGAECVNTAKAEYVFCNFYWEIKEMHILEDNLFSGGWMTGSNTISFSKASIRRLHHENP
jgi:hypothetical protein